MTSKEIKSQLKAAKLALDKQDYETARSHCQDIFQKDEGNYMSLVFAGLACLRLGEYNESRQYYKTATSIQPDGPLAWKGFADYYDKHRPVVQDDKLEAIEVYAKLLPFVENDLSKTRTAYHKLIDLHKEFHHPREIIECYDGLVSTFDPGDLSETDSSCFSDTWFQFSSYLLNRDEISEKCWEKIQKGFPAIREHETKQNLRVKLVKKFYARYLTSSVSNSVLQRFIEQECTYLLEHDSLASLPVLVHLLLIHTLPFFLEDLIDRPITLSREQREWIQLLHSCVQTSDNDGGCTDHRTKSLGWMGHALVCAADKKWMEARDALRMIVSFSTVPCECWFLSCLVHLYLCDYRQAERAAVKGVASLSSSARFISSELELSLKLFQCQIYVGQGSVKQLTQILPILAKLQGASCASHVTKLLVKAHLFLDDIPSAETILEKLHEEDENTTGLLLELQGEVALAQKDYETALTKFDEALKLRPASPLLLFDRAKVIWEDPKREKQKAYLALLQAAKADPMNAGAFVYLGDYQKQIHGDIERAKKCYQKAVTLQPSHPVASLSLGEILWSNGEEEKAYEIYKNVTSEALPSRTKVAWLRMGLYQKREKLHTESIKSYQTILSSFPDDRLLWECLGEAYLSRGSYNSALRTFTKCIQLDPNSVHCHYRIATIKNLLGQLKESLLDYSCVLDKDPTYVPALKGLGESYMQLAKQALQQNFDGCAVDHISSAIKYFTLAARLRPQFTFLWKLLGDSCICLHPVAPSVARLSVPNILQTGQSESTELKYQIVEKRELLEIGCRCYGRAIQLDMEGAYLWHDFSLGHFYLAKCYKVDDAEKEKQETINTSLKASKKAVSLNPKSHHLWNTLGVIAAWDEINDPALAQHSFIKSIQEEKNNPVAWANLGALYLKHDSTELSYEAFKKAQALSPDYAQAWIGHALVAERIGSSEAMDLFRHSTELEYHPAGSVAYGYWVCQTLKTAAPKLTRKPGGLSLNEAAHRAVLLARDNIQKLAARDMADACGLNYLGLLYEHEGLLSEARKAFKRALESSHGQTDSNVLAIKFNLARVQSKLGSAKDSIPSLMAICKEETTSTVWLELALALFKENKYEDSRQAYEQSVVISKRNSGEEDVESAVLTAQAMVVFTQGDNDTCKKFLFQAFQTTPVSLHGLVSLTALACLTNDHTLLLATLKELEKVMEWQPDEIYLLHPSCAQALHVAKFMLTCNPNNVLQDLIATISRIIEKIPEDAEPIVPPPLPLTLHTLFTESNGNTNQITSCAQRLVHSYPTSVWALAMLTAQISQVELRNAYKCYTEDKVDFELSNLSAKQKRQETSEKCLMELRSWIKNV